MMIVGPANKKYANSDRGLLKNQCMNKNIRCTQSDVTCVWYKREVFRAASVFAAFLERVSSLSTAQKRLKLASSEKGPEC